MQRHDHQPRHYLRAATVIAMQYSSARFPRTLAEQLAGKQIRHSLGAPWRNSGARPANPRPTLPSKGASSALGTCNGPPGQRTRLAQAFNLRARPTPCSPASAPLQPALRPPPPTPECDFAACPARFDMARCLSLTVPARSPTPTHRHPGRALPRPAPVLPGIAAMPRRKTVRTLAYS